MNSSFRNVSKKKSRILLDCGTNEVEFLRFYLSERFFGINVSKVRQAVVYEPNKLSTIPNVSKGFKGNYLYRSNCIPAICLRSYFGLSEIPSTSRTIMLVCDFNQCTLGFVVDGIRDIMRCSWDHFQPARQLEQSSNVITGNLLFQEEITPILDVEEILGHIIPESGIERDVPRMNISSKIDQLFNKKIVYCEDSPTVQKVLVRCLRELGLKNIESFCTGQEGLDYIRSHPGEVDLIISDIEMPRLDGLTLCKEVKMISEFQQVPFLFFSSIVTEEMRLKCQSVGGTASFSKPEITFLASYVEELLTGKSEASNTRSTISTSL